MDSSTDSTISWGNSTSMFLLVRVNTDFRYSKSCLGVPFSDRGGISATPSCGSGLGTASAGRERRSALEKKLSAPTEFMCAKVSLRSYRCK